MKKTSFETLSFIATPVFSLNLTLTGDLTGNYPQKPLKTQAKDQRTNCEHTANQERSRSGGDTEME
jgi:hypothetical protein